LLEVNAEALYICDVSLSQSIEALLKNDCFASLQKKFQTQSAKNTLLFGCDNTMAVQYSSVVSINVVEVRDLPTLSDGE
jgi:hypothetical protein